MYQAQGCKCPEMLGGWCLGFWYTMICWDPTAGKGGAPATEITDAPEGEVEMERT